MSEPRAISSEVMVSINYEIPDELHREIRILAAVRGVTIKALVIEALQLLVGQADNKGEDK